MIKLVFCLRRLPTLSASEFHRYWVEHHAELVRQHAPTLRIRRYTQNHAFSDPRLSPAIEARGGQIDPFDGVAELWWDSVESCCFPVALRLVVFLSSWLMMLSLFSSRGWESWHVTSRPLILERMPVLVDDDLRFEDGAVAPRPTTVVNRWLRELAASGCPAPGSWESYARVLLEWMRFLDEHGVALFDSRSVEGCAEPACRTPGDRPGRTAVRRYDLGAAHECAVGVLPVGYRRKLRHGTAVHLPHGAGVVRGHRS
jgi:hypothetical protein